MLKFSGIYRDIDHIAINNATTTTHTQVMYLRRGSRAGSRGNGRDVESCSESSSLVAPGTAHSGSSLQPLQDC